MSSIEAVGWASVLVVLLLVCIFVLAPAVRAAL